MEKFIVFDADGDLMSDEKSEADALKVINETLDDYEFDEGEVAEYSIYKLVKVVKAHRPSAVRTVTTVK